jgi:hypothetical protein
MCTYSMVHDWARTLPPDVWTPIRIKEYEDLIEALKKIDDMMGLPDCNPNKGEWLQELKKKIEAAEKAGWPVPKSPVVPLTPYNPEPILPPSPIIPLTPYDPLKDSKWTDDISAAFPGTEYFNPNDNNYD